MRKPVLGALALVIASQLAGCFFVSDSEVDGQFSVGWGFIVDGTTATDLTATCNTLGINKFDIRTESLDDGEVVYFRYDCNRGDAVTSPPLLDGSYEVSVELRFDNDSDPTNGPAPLYGPVSPANNAVCSGGICEIFGGDVSNIGEFLFNIPATELTFTANMNNSTGSLSSNCGSAGGSALVTSQVISLTSGSSQCIAVPLLGLSGQVTDPETCASNICQERNVVQRVRAVFAPDNYDLTVIGRNSVAESCYTGSVNFDVIDFTGGTTPLGSITALYNGCDLPKRDL